MINLCDNNKFFTDSNLSNEAKRIPRPVEDINIVGVIYSNESISFPAMSGQCGLNNIASLKMTFYDVNNHLSIDGNGPDNAVNLRQPSGLALSGILKENPLRYNHGWYTINQAFSLGALITNGTVKLNNIGYNNSRTECFKLEANNSIIANNILSLSGISFVNSKAYNSQFIANTITTDNSTKMDGVTIEGVSGTYTGGSYLESQFEHDTMISSNFTLIDCSVKTTSGNMTSPQIYRSQISTTPTGLLIIQNALSISGCNINSNKLYLEGGTSRDSNIQANTLYTLDSPHTVVNGSLTAELVDNSSFINSGSLSFYETKKLVLNNSAQVQIVYLQRNTASSINNNRNSLLNITNSGFLFNGTNNGTIVGQQIDIDTGFINNTSGIILNTQCNLYNSAVNNGYIANCNLYNSSNNASTSGITTANFYNSSTNNGVVKLGNFYDTSQNLSTGLQQGIFYSGSINNVNFPDVFIGSLTFKDSSQNKGLIYNAKFYDSGLNNGGSCYNTSFYDSSQSNSGPLINSNFFDQSEQIGESVTVSGVKFYDNSKFAFLSISNISGSLDMYNNSSGNKLVIAVNTGLKCSINDQAIVSYISGSVSDESIIFIKNKASVLYSTGNLFLSFMDQSVCGSSDAYIELYNFATASGSSYLNIVAYDTSQITNDSVSISTLTLKNSSQCLSQITSIANAELYNESKFYGNNITNGIIFGGAKLMSSGGITSTNLLFRDNAQNSITINAHTVIFSGNALNAPSGNILASKIIFDDSSQNAGPLQSITLFNRQSINNYIEKKIPISQPYYFLQSSNRGSGNNTMHFGSGSINYGYVENGLFYENSENAGTVKNATFHNTVTQTGTVLENGSFEDLTWSSPF